VETAFTLHGGSIKQTAKSQKQSKSVDMYSNQSNVRKSRTSVSSLPARRVADMPQLKECQRVSPSNASRQDQNKSMPSLLQIKSLFRPTYPSKLPGFTIWLRLDRESKCMKCYEEWRGKATAPDVNRTSSEWMDSNNDMPRALPFPHLPWQSLH